MTLRKQGYGGPYVINAFSYVNAKRVHATLKDVMSKTKTVFATYH